MLIDDPVVATGVDVSLAIVATSFTRCLHPRGGAAALTAVIGDSTVANWGLLFPLVPVAPKSCIFIVLCVLSTSFLVTTIRMLPRPSSMFIKPRTCLRLNGPGSAKRI
ncbi:HPP family protein [Pseudorhizobium marinum]|uniref:HPP family protein n=1 Tax=Pseudorhizobium marinum TaxID=1496690 RepID=UPI00069246C8